MVKIPLLFKFKKLGFVRESEFKKRIGFDYIISNHQIKGDYYIYPEHFSSSAKKIINGKRKHRFTYDVWNSGELGIPGHTRLITNYKRR